METLGNIMRRYQYLAQPLQTKNWDRSWGCGYRDYGAAVDIVQVQGAKGRVAAPARIRPSGTLRSAKLTASSSTLGRNRSNTFHAEGQLVRALHRNVLVSAKAPHACAPVEASCCILRVCSVPSAAASGIQLSAPSDSCHYQCPGCSCPGVQQTSREHKTQR